MKRSSRGWLQRPLFLSAPPTAGRAAPAASNNSSNFPSLSEAASLQTLSRGAVPQHCVSASPRRTLVWFRTADLRLLDNAIVSAGAGPGVEQCLPVFIADPAVFGARTPAALGKRSRVGPHRAKFVLEAVADLRARLRSVGSDLLVATGSPAAVMAKLLELGNGGAAATGGAEVGEASSAAAAAPTLTTHVFVSDEPCPEERDEADAVEAAITPLGGVLHRRWQRTLYHPDDLPAEASVAAIAETSRQSGSFQFTTWRKKLETSLGPRRNGLREPLPAPEKMPPVWREVSADAPAAEAGQRSPMLFENCGFDYMPTMAELGVPATMLECLTGEPAEQRHKMDAKLKYLVEADAGCMFDDGAEGRFVGGETAALKRLHDWIWEQNGPESYLDTRNGLLGSGYSTKLSPWLATGALSPRTVMQEVKEWERKNGESKSSYWIYFELLWRDFFSFVASIVGPQLFAPRGPLPAVFGQGKLDWNHPEGGWKGSDSAFVRWATGNTGWPLVDAGMRELAATGFSSNRARQNLASFLSLELGCDWRLGAAWFEACLIDHDPASNYGNWAAAAGLTGGRINRFNILKQGKDYDRDGSFVRRWCPELAKLPDAAVHAPWQSSQEAQRRANCIVGDRAENDYPTPMKSAFVWGSIDIPSNRGGKRVSRAQGGPGRGNNNGKKRPDKRSRMGQQQRRGGGPARP